jgi:glycine/D-amino acid oxidase-like deaminating enzyme
MALPSTADIIIVGAGISGAAAAAKISAADPNLNVVVLESEAKGNGSTTRSAAAFRHQFSSKINIEMSLFSGTEYENFHELTGVEGTFVQNGYLFVYSDPQQMADAAERAAFHTEVGIPDVEVLDGEQTRERFPYIDSSEVVGSTFCRHDGFVLPDRIMDGYLDLAQKHGTTLHQNSPVTAIHQEHGAITGVTVNGSHRIDCPTVINAAGPWSRHVARLADCDIPITPVKRYLYFTNQVEGRDVTGFPLIVLDLEVYFRPEHNGFMLGWDLRPEKPTGWDQFPPADVPHASINDDIEPGYGKDMEDYGYEILFQVAEKLSFFEESVGIESVTSGYYIIAPDEKAIVDRDPRVEGLIHATGFSGHGVMHAPATGEILRDLALNLDSQFHIGGLALEPLLKNEAREDPEKMVI